MENESERQSCEEQQGTEIEGAQRVGKFFFFPVGEKIAQLASHVRSRGHRSRAKDLPTRIKGQESEVVFATAQATALPSDSVVLTLHWASVIRALGCSWLFCIQTDTGFHLS